MVHKCDCVFSNGVLCNKVFKKKKELVAHVKEDHKVDVEDVCKVLVNNKECGFIFKGQRSYKVHFTYKHKPTVCEVCKKKLANKGELIRHKEKEHSPKYLQCQNAWCKRSFAKRSSLVLHQYDCRDPKDPIRCGVPRCSKTFKRVREYKRHLTFHKISEETREDLLGKYAKKNKGEIKLGLKETSKKKVKSNNLHDSRSLLPFHQEVLDSSDLENSILREKLMSGNLLNGFVFGKPVDHQILQFKNFVIQYDYEYRGPSLTYEELDYNYLQSNLKPLDGEFAVDKRIPYPFRISTRDYLNHDEYDRGHMVAAQNHLNDMEAFKQTYVLSNILPQLRDFNQRIWRRLENYVIRFASNYDKVYVYTGPVFDIFEQRFFMSGNKKIPIPNEFFKIIIGKKTKKKQFDIELYKIPHRVHEDNNLSRFLCELKLIERKTGLELGKNFPTESFMKLNGRNVGNN